jgi:GT2 family glycosyltransferase
VVREHLAVVADDVSNDDAPPGRVEHACVIGNALLVAGWRVDGSSRDSAHRSAARRVRAIDLAPASVASGSQDATRFLAIVDGDAGTEPCVLAVGRSRVQLDPDALIRLDPQAFAWTALDGLDADARARAAAFAATMVGPAGAPAGRHATAQQLHALHDSLRPRYAPCVIAPEQPRGLFVDTILAVDERGFYMRGWMRSDDGAIVRLIATAPEGACADVTDATYRFVRPDIGQFYGDDADAQRRDRPGFIAYFELGAPSVLRDGWTIALTDETGTTVETTVPAVVTDGLTVRTTILGDLVHEQAPGDELLREHAFPAISRLQERLAREADVASVHQLGTPPADPDVTVIVPLYRRIDFMEHQLAQLVHDPEFATVDLLYVLDSPELADATLDYARALHRLYRLPFRVAIMNRNSGFAIANNAGAELARGRLLLLMNSDVLPDRPGWLGTLVDFHDATPGIGALGPKLLYEDGSIQHAGLWFLRPDGSPWWENAHHFKGMHRSFPAANVSRPVAAVTGGCLLVARDRWRAVGGLQGAYVQGDYEDSDLCLRLAQLGCTHWYLPDVELYHLEGQSYPTELRRLTSRYNTWLHTHLWGAQIEELVSQPPTSRRARARRTKSKRQE